MMPGESQSKAGEVASDATSGTCQNCGILTRSLDEYMSALVALKQKIIDTDHLLSEYKEKCDELQKSQRESSTLHKQLDEVLQKLGPLEKQTADHEAVKTELAEMKTLVKSYQQKSEEVEDLRAENTRALALKQRLEETLKKAEDTAEMQNMENTKLRSEKKSVEEDLQKTRDSLRTCQQATEELEILRLQNAKTLILKSNLENQLLAFEDTNLQQSNEIRELKCVTSSMSEALLSTQEKLQKLEKEFNKEKTNMSTQTERETEVDKAKVRSLLQQLWQCVDPLSQTTEKLDLTDPPDSQTFTTPPNHRLQRAPFQPLSGGLIGKPQWAISSPAKGPSPQTPGPSTSRLEASPGKSKLQSLCQGQKSPNREQVRRKPVKKKRCLESEGSNESGAPVLRVPELPPEDEDKGPTVGDDWGNCTDLWEILEIFRPLPALLSPMSSPPKQSAEMDDAPSLLDVKPGTPSSNKDTENSAQSTDLKLLEAVVAVQSSLSDSLLKTNSSCSEIPSVPPCTDNVVCDDFLSECQDMEVEELSEGKEKCDSGVIGAEGLRNGREGLGVQLSPARIIPTGSQLIPTGSQLIPTGSQLSTTGSQLIPTGSQLSTTEDHVKTMNQSNAGSELPRTLCNEVINKGSDSGPQPMNTDHKCPDTDDVQEDQGSVSPEEIQSSPEQTQSVLTPEDTTTRIYSNIHDSSCTKVDGVSSLGSSNDDESSAEKELLCLEKKVRLDSSHPLNSTGVYDAGSVERQESVTLAQRMSSEAERVEGVSNTALDLESERNCVILQDKSDSENICPPATPAENVAEDGQRVSDVHRQEAHKPPETFGSDVDDADGRLATGLKEHISEAEDQITVDPQEACPPCSSTPAEPPTLPSLDQGVNLSPLVGSRDAPSPAPSPDSIRRVRTEMGPPLPPVVMPLTATPPKFAKNHNPVRPHVPMPAWQPADAPHPPVQQESSPNSSFEDEAKVSPCLTTPSPSCLGVPSFPLQFGSETPKHAVPVPGRLPSSALSSSSPTVSQESSMQLLDTMYPELSAQARTLTILRGKVGLGAESVSSPPAVSQISGNKTINSSSTAFTKTEQKPKRTGVNMLLPKSAKRLRLDACSPGPAKVPLPLQQFGDAQPSSDAPPAGPQPANGLLSGQETRTECGGDILRTEKRCQVSEAIDKIQASCFDVLPVIKSHVFLGRISKVPVLRDEEKAVLSDFSSNQSSAEELMLAILSKMKTERAGMTPDHLHALCRVYVGLCRQRHDYQKVHALVYHLLKEDFPEAVKMILFAVTTWPTVLSHEGPLCKAIHTVSKSKAEGELLEYLTAYLHWDKTPCDDMSNMVRSTLKALLEDGDLKFQKHDRYGDDLCPRAWEYIFTVDLLCAHLGWKWTLENIIGKELWPVMNTWVTQPRHEQTPVRDVCVAAVLRLIGRLGQLGIKEKLCEFVQNVSKPINLFAKHGIAEGVPWAVQLSAVYAIYDLAPINPKEALEALASWRGDTTQPVPPAVTSCITQIGSLCRQIKP
ncbi:little elongation complex subunit 1 [Brachyhypopomus gauderio]|uniref:little elongation complex subunit 1 n=1 Tax=Brachyhypopomus gauderio TaxID=698409 RepID=UPI00404268CE